MNISPHKAKTFALGLLRGKRKTGKSWRQIAHDDYQNKINQATLSRIARSKGAWLPKDDRILIVLGLKVPCKPHTQRELLPGEKETKKHIAAMAKNLRNSFKEFLS